MLEHTFLDVMLVQNFNTSQKRNSKRVQRNNFPRFKQSLNERGSEELLLKMEGKKLEMKSNLFGNARRAEKVRKHTNNMVCINPGNLATNCASKCLLWEELQGAKVGGKGGGVKNGLA